MALAVNHPRRLPFRHSSRTATTLAEPRVITRPLGASIAGVAALLVGIWGAIAGYIGPYFNFYPTSGQAWDWNLQNGLLHLLPGGVAVLAALVLLARPSRSAARVGALGLPALVLLAAGAWFVIGPVAWPMFASGPAFAPSLDAGTNLLNQACASLAPGLALAAFAGMALKAAVARPVVDSIVPAPAGATRADAVEPTAAGPVTRSTAAEPTTAAERTTAAEPAARADTEV